MGPAPAGSPPHPSQAHSPILTKPCVGHRRSSCASPSSQKVYSRPSNEWSCGPSEWSCGPSHPSMPSTPLSCPSHHLSSPSRHLVLPLLPLTPLSGPPAWGGPTPGGTPDILRGPHPHASHPDILRGPHPIVTGCSPSLAEVTLPLALAGSPDPFLVGGEEPAPASPLQSPVASPGSPWARRCGRVPPWAHAVAAVPLAVSPSGPTL